MEKTEEKFTRRLVLQLPPDAWTRFETAMKRHGYTSYTGAFTAMLDLWAKEGKS